MIRDLLTSRILKLVVMGCCIAIAAMIFHSKKTQSINWTFPYFSGAANFKTVLDWQISPSEYDKIAKLTNEEHYDYRYIATEHTVKNNFNNYGYVLIALISRTLFSWMGDIQAVIIFQVLVHIILSLFVITYLIKSTFQRRLFFILFAINPLVLYFVSFPFYYYWTVIPSIVFAIVWHKPHKSPILLPFLTIVLLLSLLIRPTTLLVALLIFPISFLRYQKYRYVVILSFSVFILGVFFLQQQGTKSSPWHTAYIGIGAYANKYNIDSPSDEEGYKFYNQITGEIISTHAIKGTTNNTILWDKYHSVLKHRYFEIISKSPGLIIRNALINTSQAFGIGYIADHSWSRPITILIGFLVIIILIITRQWIWGLGILAYSATFTPYFPPIPAYLFGAYFFTALGLSAAFEVLWRWWRFDENPWKLTKS